MNRARFLKLSATGFLGMLTLKGCMLPRNDTDASASVQIICMADLHSSHRFFPRILHFVEQLAQQSDKRLLILINGDIFESSNSVTSRSNGALEWFFLERLGKMAQVVVNIGNHEGAVHNDLRTVVRNIRDRDMAAISSLKNADNGNHLGNSAITVMQNDQLVRVIGLSCSNPEVYRSVHRSRWDFPQPAAYLSANMGTLLHDGALHVVMNHDGILADKEILNSLPLGSIILGGHDHIRAQSQSDRWLALHTSWGGHLCDIIEIENINTKNPLSYTISTIAFDEQLEEDEAMANMVRSRENQHLTPEERTIAGTYNQRVSQNQFLINTVSWFRQQVKTDAVFVNNTTFGPVLPNGPVRVYDINNTVRFDSRLFRATVSGSALQTIVDRANQFNNFSWEARTGEFVVGDYPAEIDPAKQYTIAVNGWVALEQNQAQFLGLQGLEFEQLTSEPRMRQIIANQLG